MSESERVRVPSHVAARQFADETILLNLATGEYHGLDATGSAFLAALEANAHVQGAVDELLEAYDVGEATLRSDLETFRSALIRRGLLEFQDDA